MPGGSASGSVLGVLVAVATLIAMMAGGALSFHEKVLTEVRTTVASELKHAVTREELADLRRQTAEVDHQRFLAIIRRLDAIEYQVKTIRGRR